MQGRCQKYTDCVLCEHYRKDVFKYRTFPRGKFIPQTRCSRNTIYFILSGETWVNSSEYPDTIVREGHFLLQPLGSVVEFRIHTPLEAILFMFDHVQNVCVAHFSQVQPPLEGRQQSTSIVLETVTPLQMFLQGMRYALNDTLLCHGYLEAKQVELFYLLNCYYSIKELNDFFASVYDQGKGFRSFVMSHYLQVKDVDAFAKLGGYSLTTFRRLFKETFDEPVYQWLLKQKCRDIYKELSTTDKSITEISRQYGFGSLANFSHFCKANFGKSPRALRSPK
ncbi:MAG: helix-turn-helix transcriptional regulator [Tannerella sp.]|jgi:AraC-like DNA-binding protein|nr:helix-turn-helix transcriptional regulator [Tannerella sp.]